MEISIVTPTIRNAGLYLIKKALDRQTFTNFEWIICSPDKPKILEECAFDVTWLEDDFTGGVWTLNRAYNYMIKQARGELLVSWQDYTFAKPDGLQKFWDCYQAYPDALVSGVGNKYSDESWTSITWKDPRQRSDFGSFYETEFHNIEWNWCSCPKEAMYTVGGFDEGADALYFGMDGYGVNERLDLLGYKFYLDQSNESFSLGHGRVEGWDENNGINGKYTQRKRELFDKREFPVLNYLKRL